ncbi:hypothetical protein F2P81_009610 [Scophthalmus maximus]|uniref:Uncharacterized protein n=1 Tax=Scophthalmus maximus TaxID=52904 RepID=A0A6A4SV65_SCOMX|nr:hypothetical protein F2P81_009610 [Scophthalmus maximus]
MARRGRNAVRARMLEAKQSRLLRYLASTLLKHGSITGAGQQNKPPPRGLHQLNARKTDRVDSYFLHLLLPGIVIPASKCNVTQSYCNYTAKICSGVVHNSGISFASYHIRIYTDTGKYTYSFYVNRFNHINEL